MVSIMLSQPMFEQPFRQTCKDQRAMLPVRFGLKPLPQDKPSGHHGTQQVADGCGQPQHSANLTQPRISLYSLGQRAQDDDPSDNLLRRKTPHGTLAAGYDGSLLEHPSGSINRKNAGAPTSKLARRASQTLDCGVSTDKSYAKVCIQSTRSETQACQRNTVYHATKFVNGSARSKDECQRTSTILQPLWPPNIDPAALQSTAQIASYRSDTAFQVYPGARDGGFEDHRSVEREPSNVDRPQNTKQGLSASSDFGLAVDRQADRHLRSLGTNGDASIEKENMLPLQAPTNAMHSHLAFVPDPGAAHERSNSTISSTFTIEGLAQCPPPLTLGPPSSNAHFRDRILHWAHGIYCTLLSSDEHSRQHRRSMRVQIAKPDQHEHLQHPYQPWSHQNQASTSSPTNLAEPKWQSIMNTSNIPPRATTTEDLRFSSVKQLAGAHLDRCSQQLNPSDPSIPILPSDNTLRHAPGVVSSLHVSCNVRSAPVVTVAWHALDILSHLCQESQWQWVDGMLLTGCLAYGLGLYSKAIKWYSKALRQDPINVEAMSNLAATYLAIGRKTEAEQYWMKSIRHRPGHFEAIENLVGLLNDDGRRRDAVNVVQHVQDCLRYGKKCNTSSEGSLTLENYEYCVSPRDIGRLLALVHGKGNVLYQCGDNEGAAQAFEDTIVMGAGYFEGGIRGLINHISRVFTQCWQSFVVTRSGSDSGSPLILLPPELALEAARLVFPPRGRLPGLKGIAKGGAQRAAISIVSNSLLSLAKIYQDGISSGGAALPMRRAGSSVREILALYYLSLSLQPSPSTANNVGILLASIQQPVNIDRLLVFQSSYPQSLISGVVPGSGVALALAYYDYGLKLDAKHAHLYTNLGSLCKDIGHLSSAIRMYERAVECDGSFDIALANLANAVKDKGNIRDAIVYYRRAIESNPEFSEAVCGLANALNSVCDWRGRGGRADGGIDRWHVDQQGQLCMPYKNFGWMNHVLRITQDQLIDGRKWGKGTITAEGLGHVMSACLKVQTPSEIGLVACALNGWVGDDWEGARIVRLVERATKVLIWRCYRQRLHDTPTSGSFIDPARPILPSSLTIPNAPTVLPFHTFTMPLTASQIRRIAARNAIRTSCTALKAPWLSTTIYKPPMPPNPHLNVGYVSSDFGNHPLSHLMVSVFGMHDPLKVQAFCYATTASDGSIHRRQIEQESPFFRDCSAWPIDRLVQQIVTDGIHILVNLNGYTRGAKNEVFAARPAPIQVSFMGFAGTLGAEWCDYLLADEIAVPRGTLRPFRNNVSIVDQIQDGNDEDDGDWIYSENLIYCPATFFCCDHKQSAPDAHEGRLTWLEERVRRQAMRQTMFPDLLPDVVILGNFNQLYKIEPTTFRCWLRILSRVPKAVLWLLRFPDLGEEHLRRTAEQWVGTEVASRLRFTDVASKQEHILRASVCDLFLDTPECNAHTTAADVLWSGTPILTFPKYEYKMCSRIAASILRSALPSDMEGNRAAKELIVHDYETYEDQAVELAHDLSIKVTSEPAKARLLQIRRLLFESRWTSALFDTRRWVTDLETGYGMVWRNWVEGIGGDIWIP